MGQADLLHEILRTIRDPIENADEYRQLGIKLPRGILLWGPPGTGKTCLLRQVVRELGWHSIQLDASTILSQWWGDSEARLQALFEEARAHAPSLILIDEIDAIFPTRTADSSVDARLVAAFLTQLDGISADVDDAYNLKFFVLATTNSPHSVDPAIRRPGRLDKEFELVPPSAEERRAILKRLTDNRVGESVDLKWLTACTGGFVMADLCLLWKEAGLNCLRRRHSSPLEIPLQVTREDFEHALTLVRPSGLREVATEKPTVNISELAGIDGIRLAIEHSILGPMRDREKYARFGVRPAKGVLLYGPPGCSKTMTSRAIAAELGLNFIAIRGPELLRKYVGESEKALGDDEFDGMFQSSKAQDRLVTQLLTELDAIGEGVHVFVIAATNRPDAIDSAVLRSGRFDKFIYAGLPALEERKAIIDRIMSQYRVGKDLEVDRIASETEGFSHAEVAHVFNNAAMRALQRDPTADSIIMSDLIEAARAHQPQTSRKVLEYYESFNKVL